MKDGIAVSDTSGRAFPWAPPPWELDREVPLNIWSHVNETLLGVLEELVIVGRHRRMSGSGSGQSVQAAMESDERALSLFALFSIFLYFLLPEDFDTNRPCHNVYHFQDSLVSVPPLLLTTRDGFTNTIYLSGDREDVIQAYEEQIKHGFNVDSANNAIQPTKGLAPQERVCLLSIILSC